MSTYVVAVAARQDLLDIRSYLSEHADDETARRVVADLVATFRLLAEHSQIGWLHRHLVDGMSLRCWISGRYLIVYRRRTMNSEGALGDHVEIVRVLHQSRDTHGILRRVA